MAHYNDILKNNESEYSAIDTGTNFAEKCEDPGSYIVELTRVELKEIKNIWKILWDGKILEGPNKGMVIPTIFTGIEGNDLKWTKTFLSRIDAMPKKAKDIPEVIEGLKGLIVEVDVTINSSGYLNSYIKKLVELRASDPSGISEIKAKTTDISDLVQEEETNPLEEELSNSTKKNIEEEVEKKNRIVDQASNSEGEYGDDPF